MTAVVLNEHSSLEEIEALQSASGEFSVELWPTGKAAVPEGVAVVILIVRSKSTKLEEQRAENVVREGLRVVCVRLEDLDEISNVAEMICTTNVGLHGDALQGALGGNDSVQQTSKGETLPTPPRDRNKCS